MVRAQIGGARLPAPALPTDLSQGEGTATWSTATDARATALLLGFAQK